MRLLLCLAVLCAGPAAAQSPAERERAAYVDWLASAPNSPFAAVAQQSIGAGVTLGPGAADVPLDGIGGYRVTPRGGGLVLEGPDGSRPLPRHRPVRLGRYTLVATGTAGREVITVFGERRADATMPTHYAYDPKVAFVGVLVPPARASEVRVLSVDGVEVVAHEAGLVAVPIGGAATRLKVRRIPDPASDESELEIFFRDGSNGDGTYPAGRFVSLEPLPDGTYRLDFNRARSPFCAYNSVYPCPAPWSGNTIPAPVRAGERYAGGGLAAPLPAAEGE